MVCDLQAMPHAFTQTGVVLGTVLYVLIGLIVVVRSHRPSRTTITIPVHATALSSLERAQPVIALP